MKRLNDAVMRSRCESEKMLSTAKSMKSKYADDHLHEKARTCSTDRKPTSEDSGNERKRTPSIAMRYCRFGPCNAFTINEFTRTST